MSEATETTTSSSANPRVDRLTIVQQLGAGSIGTVAKAKSPKYESFVALRQFQVPEWLDDANELIKSLLAEARSANALNHPNIAKLHTGGFKGFTVFLTSEFIEGPGIKQHLGSRAFNLNEVVELGRQLCLALDHAHEKGVVHHCLTPSNLKVTAEGTLKVLDFGLMRHKDIYSPIPAKRLENEHYLSPEQVKNKPADRTSNVFTAGSILYELLTTRHPFAGKHLGEVDKNICEAEPQPLYAINSRIPESISRVVLRALSKNPRDRFQSTKEMADALSEALSAPPAKPVASATGTGSFPAVAPKATPPSITTSQKIPAVTTSQKIPVVPALASQVASPSAPIPSVEAPPAAGTPVVAPSPAATSAEVKAVPSTKSTTTRPAPTKAVKPQKMPPRLMAQWKLAAAVVALLFVVSALAISLRHKKTPIPEPASEPVSVATQPASVPQDPSITETPVSVANPESASAPRRTRTKSNTPEPVAVTPAAPTTGELSISSVPPGATVEIAGRGESGKTPQNVGSLLPGKYQVTVSKAGYAPQTRAVEVVAGNHASLDVTLVATKAYLTVAGTPTGANVLIDGKDSGKVTPSDFTLDPATHNITVHKEGFLDSTTDIKLAAGQSTNYAPTLKLAGRTDNIKVVGGGFKKLFGGGGSNSGLTNVEFKTDPKGAKVTINGRTLDKSTPFEIQVEPGNYEITIQKSGYKPVHTNLAAGANEKVKIEEKLEQQ